MKKKGKNGRESLTLIRKCRGYGWSFVSHAGTQPDGCGVLSLSQLKRRAEGFHCDCVASLADAGPSFQWPAGKADHHRQTCNRPSDQYACANMSSSMDCGPIFVCEACRRFNAAQRIFSAAAWLCLQSGSPK